MYGCPGFDICRSSLLYFFQEVHQGSGRLFLSSLVAGVVTQIKTAKKVK